MTEEEKKRMRDELRRKRQAENREKAANGSKWAAGPTATTGREDTNGALNQAAGTGAEKTRPKAAGARAKAAGAAAAKAPKTPTTETFGPPVPEHLQHDAELDRQFVDGFIKARMQGPQALEAWIGALPKPKDTDEATTRVRWADGQNETQARETDANNAAEDTNLPDAQKAMDTLPTGQSGEEAAFSGDAQNAALDAADEQEADAQEPPDEVGLVESALQRAEEEAAAEDAVMTDTPPTPDPTAEPTTEPTIEPTTAPTPGPTVEPTTNLPPEPLPAPTPGPTVEPTTNLPPEPLPGPTPDPTAEPTTESTTEPTTEPTAEPTPTAGESENEAASSGEPTAESGATEAADIWSANEGIVAELDAQLEKVAAQIAQLDEAIATTSGAYRETLIEVRDQLVESRMELRDERARAVNKDTFAEQKVRSIDAERDALTAQLEAGDYRAFIEDEELWDAVRDDPEAAKYAAQTEYERQLKELNLKRAVVLAHQAQDDEMRFYRSTANSRWLNLLYEREIALQQGDAARVQELNADMDAAGFERKWPEEVAAEQALEAEMIAFQRERGDEETRNKLGYAVDRELTDEDYLRAAEIGMSFWDFDLWHDSEAIQKVLSLRSDANLLEEIQENGIINGLFSFSEKTKVGYEERLDQAAEAIIGDGAGYSQIETTKDVLALGPAVIGGLSQGAFSLIDAIPYLASNLYYMVNKDRMGTGETREQMRMDDGFFNILCSIGDFTSNTMGALDVDLSQRAEWVKTTESISYTVGQNRAVYGLSNLIGKLFAVNLAHTVPQAEKLFTTVRFLTQDVGFWITGYKSSMQEALAEGATYEQAFWYGVVGASISTAVEHIDDLGGRYLDSPDSAAKGLMKYFEGRGKNWEFGVKLLSSFFGERIESRVEDPSQALAQKIIYDHDMPIFGEGGVIDPARSNRSAWIDGLGGLILGFFGGVSARRADTDARIRENANAETGKPNTAAIDSVAKAAAALGDENSSQKTQDAATKVIDRVAETGAAAPEYMMKALEDARIDDIAAHETGGTVAQLQGELNQAQSSLKAAVTQRSAAEAKTQQLAQQVQSARRALAENPTPENLKLYQQAQSALKNARQQQEIARQEVLRTQREVTGLQTQEKAASKTAKIQKERVSEAIRGVRDGIAALPDGQQNELRALWQKNVEALGMAEGTAATLEAVRERMEAEKFATDSATSEKTENDTMNDTDDIVRRNLEEINGSNDELGEIVTHDELSKTEDSSDGVDGKNAGKTLSSESAKEYAYHAIKGNPNATSIVLGKYEKNSPRSYDEVAKEIDA